MSDDIFSPQNQVKSAFVSWGKVQDWIKGTLLEVRLVPNQFAKEPGTKQKVYDLRASAGSYHDMDAKHNPVEPPIAVKEGDLLSVGGKPGIDAQMRNVKPGTIVGLRFEEEREDPQGKNYPTKVIRVYAGGQDPNYMGEGAEDLPFST